ncbi:uncharacterized protein [Cherax quadricarinatus]|uniref:uncharacterized protein n=1 Tax=Cherax quadricarinatus TaxID=27406 RepID=UPI002378F861|nr:uncharacterized protein LOC128689671 [Cherax quadricarinatus]
MDVITIIIIVCFAVPSYGLRYTDLEVIEAACSPYNSCERDKPVSIPDWHNENCLCDEMCAEFGDCCLDSPYYNLTVHKYNVNKYQCISLVQYGDIYMKGTCQEGWQDEEVSNQCLSGSPASAGREDPVGNLPATSLASSRTYTNYYCAICNNDTHALRVWSARWECGTLSKYSQNLTQEYVISRLVFNSYEWGVNLDNNGAVEFQKCSILPVRPEELINVTRSCTPAIKTCEREWEGTEVADSCQSYTAVVYNHTLPYKNPHCAKCNNVSQEQLNCMSQDLLRIGKKTFFSSQAFSLLFDFHDSSGSNTVGSTSSCQSSEIWDHFFGKCRSIVCGKPNHVFKYGKCVPNDSGFNATVNTDPNTTPSPTTSTDSAVIGKNNTPIIFPDVNGSIIFPGDTSYNTSVYTTSPLPTTFSVSNTAVSSNESYKFLDCNKIVLSHDEFVMYENRTVLVEPYNRSYIMGEYELTEGGVLVCSPQTPTEKFSQVMGWVTLAGLGLSCLCLLLHLAVFLLVAELRNLSGKNLASLCLALLISYIVFIFNVFVKPGQECFVLAAVMYYFFLSSFTWMNVVAFDIWYTFHQTKTDLRVISGKQRQKFLMYSLYSWLLPAVADLIVVMVDIKKPSGIPDDYLPILGQRWCWFGHRKALLIFFAIPIVAIIVVNCAFFISTARIIAETTLSTSAMTTSPHHKNQYKLYMRLAALMGFTWISGIAAGYLDLEAVWYIFVVLNTLQGVFIFLGFTCRTKVWRAVSFTCRHLMQLGASLVVGHGRSGSTTVELNDTPNHHSSPVTTLDGS